MNKEDFKKLIPNFKDLHDAVRDYILEKQGDKGFILTDDNSNDRIYAIDYDFGEDLIYAIKADRNDIFVLRESEIADILCHQKIEDIASNEECGWTPLCSEIIVFSATLLSIAESIEQYI